jgi:hypothetical protein
VPGESPKAIRLLVGMPAVDDEPELGAQRGLDETLSVEELLADHVDPQDQLDPKERLDDRPPDRRLRLLAGLAPTLRSSTSLCLTQNR